MNAITQSQTPATLQRIARELERDPRLASSSTRRGYLHDLRQFEIWRGARTFTKLLVEQYAAELQQAGRSPASINRALAATRWWARRMGDLAQEGNLDEAERRVVDAQTARIVEVKDVRGERPQKGRHVEQGEVTALLTVCADDPTPAGARDAAVIALAFSTGMRRAELVGLQLDDVKRLESGDFDLTVHGKGNKVRAAYVFNGAAAALSDWLALRGEQPGALFLPVDKYGRVVIGSRKCGVRGVHGKGAGVEVEPRLNTDALAQMLAKRAAQAGVGSITWHDCRRSFAGNLLDAGTDLVVVQKLLGHSSPVTTANYDRRPDEAKRKAVRALHVAYKRRAK